MEDEQTHIYEKKKAIEEGNDEDAVKGALVQFFNNDLDIQNMKNKMMKKLGLKND